MKLRVIDALVLTDTENGRGMWVDLLNDRVCRALPFDQPTAVYSRLEQRGEPIPADVRSAVLRCLGARNA